MLRCGVLARRCERVHGDFVTSENFHLPLPAKNSVDRDMLCEPEIPSHIAGRPEGESAFFGLGMAA
jgi:hypothetical protein